jgi:hypothetical protein
VNNSGEKRWRTQAHLSYIRLPKMPNNYKFTLETTTTVLAELQPRKSKDKK